MNALCLRAVLIFLFGAVSVRTEAANFVCADQEILKAAEAARIDSALFWTGKRLPGDWYAPCPIRVVPAEHSGGGMTQFRFESGEVHGWSMTVEGSRSAIIRDVIPHEVDHAVRASLLRHPIERWLDEGCATLFESPATQQRLRKIAKCATPDIIQSRWLNGQDYPARSDEIESLYAVGFSLVEYLLSLKDPAALLEFQKRSGTVESRLESVYRLSVFEFREGWNEWRQADTQTARLLKCHCPDRKKPLLVIWTAQWCRPCQSFWQQWQSDAKFRQIIQQQYHVHILDYDRHRGLALTHQIRTLPTFQTQTTRIVGFDSQSTLLEKLGLNITAGETVVSPSIIPVEQSSSASSTIVEPFLEHNDVSVKKAVNDDRDPTSADTSLLSRHSPTLGERVQVALPVGLTLLQWAGIIGGTAATGGLAGFAIAVLPKLLSLRRRYFQRGGNRSEEGRESDSHIPFPRELDEAGQLLELRQSEGRVAVLDALRGMFLEDEIEKLKKSEADALVINQLMSAIDQRVDQVAPLSTKLESQ